MRSEFYFVRKEDWFVRIGNVFQNLIYRYIYCMEYNRRNTLVCIDHTKDACLYFDEVIPLNLGHIIPWNNNGDLEAHEVLHDILPAPLLDASSPLGMNMSVLSYLEAYINVFPISMGIGNEIPEEEMNKRAKHFFPLLMKRKDEMLERLPKSVDSIFGTQQTAKDSETAAGDPAFILTGLKLIDTSGIQWREILELRSDAEAMAKLRMLRTFIFQNYKDKPLAFIEDDLLNRIELYQTTAKQLGLKTSDASMKIVFNSANAVAGTVATIASALAGVPVTIPLALGIGTTFLLGNVGLELRAFKRETYKFRQENPVTYLVDIKNKLL